MDMDKEKIIRNNLNLQDLLTNELLKKHSISALMQLLDMGREIELTYNNHVVSITHSNGKLLLVYKEKTQYFDNIWSVVIKGEIDEEYFVNYWNRMNIKGLF